MIDYTSTLLLLYLKEVGSEYDFSEAKQLLGLTHFQLEQVLLNLIKDGLVEYQDYTLKISYKGIRHLISNNNITYHLHDTSVLSLNSESGIKLPVDAIYIPRNFQNKYTIK